MPGQQQRSQSSQQTTQPATTSEVAPSGAQSLQGNAALQSKLPAPTSLYTELRNKVGDALADAILENLSEDELLGHVNPLIDDFLAQAKEAAAADPSHELTEAELSTAFADLDSKLEEAAKAFLTQLDVDGKLASIAKEHTELVALAAIAGAVAWALKTNPDIPELSKDKDLGGGHSISGTIDMGRLLDLTLERLEAGWKYDGDQTDIAVDGDWSSKDGLDSWGLGATLAHDGDNTDINLDGKYRNENGQDSWSLGGNAVHTGEHSTTTLSGRLEDNGQDRTGHLSGRHIHDNDGRRTELGGQYNLDGSWNADASHSRTDGDKKWSLGATGQQDVDGTFLGTVSGAHSNKHDGFDHSLSGIYRTDGTWNANGSVTGQDKDNPWSISAQAGRTSSDPEVDWSITGEMRRQLDDQGNTILSGQQSLSRDESLSRLQLDHSLGGDHSLSAWVERERGVNGTVDALGGSINTSIMGNDAYAKGWMKSNNTWEASAGIESNTDNDNLSWFAEGYTGRNELGQDDYGARAGLKWRF